MFSIFENLKQNTCMIDFARKKKKVVSKILGEPMMKEWPTDLVVSDTA